MPVPLQQRQGIRATGDKAVDCSAQFCQLLMLSRCKSALLSLPQQTLMAAPLVWWERFLGHRLQGLITHMLQISNNTTQLGTEIVE